MSEHDDHRGRSRHAGARLRALRAVTLVVVLAVASRAWGGEPGDEQGVTPEQTVASAIEAAAGATRAGDAQTSQARTERDDGVRVATRRFKRTSGDKRTAKVGGGSGLETAPSPDTSSPWYRSAISSLAVVLALVGVAYFVVRRFVPAARASESGLLRVVARAALSPKHSVALVHLGRRFVIVGVSPDRLDALCEIHDAEEVAELTARAGVDAFRRRSGFDETLVREVSQLREPAGGAEEEASPARRRPLTTREPLTDLLNRLRTLQSK